MLADWLWQVTEHQWLLRIGNAKKESVTAKKMAFITVTVTAIFPNRIVMSDGTLHATVFIMDMIYICLLIRKAIYQYFLIFRVHLNMILMDFCRLFSE